MTDRSPPGSVSVVGNPFVEATTVRAVAPGRYEGEIDEAWNLRPMPQGGVVTALAARAMSDTLDDPGQVLRTLHTAYVAPVAHGPVAVEVELLRRGRSMSHLRAEVVNQGNAHGHVTTAVFGAERSGFSFTDLTPPAGPPPPDECPSFRDPRPPDAAAFQSMRFWEEILDGRTAMGHPPWEDYVPDRAERMLWYRFDDLPRRDDGTLDQLALLVMADTMPGAVGERLGRQDRMWFAPSVDLTVHVLDEWRSPWLLGHNRARFAGGGYASVDMALWDLGETHRDPPRLVAYATQLCLFTFLD